MSHLRKFPNKYKCQNWLGYGKDSNDRGICGEPAVIRCNACKEYFCEECWQDHLEMTVVVQRDCPDGAGQVLVSQSPRMDASQDRRQRA